MALLSQIPDTDSQWFQFGKRLLIYFWLEKASRRNGTRFGQEHLRALISLIRVRVFD